MKGVLEGIRILELGNFISGPYAAALLADMGAEVIKVENPKGGDPFRGWDLGGDQPNFWAFNRGKKSVTLNLQTPEGKEIFYGLVKESDVVIENYRPGVTKKLGIDYETLRKINERIICCSITGTGPTGPYVHRPAYDTVGQGLGGMMSVLMDPKNPRPIGPAYADHLSGLYSAVGVLGALVARAKTGKGQQIDATMAGAVLGFLTAPATETLAHGRPPGPYTRPRQSQTYAFSGSDGLPFAIHLSSPQKFWEGLCNSVGRPELIEDPRFKTRPDRRKNYDELNQTFAELFPRKAAVPIGWNNWKRMTCPTRRSTTWRRFFRTRRSNTWAWRFRSIAKTNRPSKPLSSRWSTATIRFNILRRRRNSASTTASF